MDSVGSNEDGGLEHFSNRSEDPGGQKNASTTVERVNPQSRTAATNASLIQFPAGDPATEVQPRTHPSLAQREHVPPTHCTSQVVSFDTHQPQILPTETLESVNVNAVGIQEKASGLNYGELSLPTSINWLPFCDPSDLELDLDWAQITSTFIPETVQWGTLPALEITQTRSSNPSLAQNEHLDQPHFNHSRYSISTVSDQSNSPLALSTTSAATKLSTGTRYVDGAASRDTKYRDLPGRAPSIFFSKRRRRQTSQPYGFINMENIVEDIPDNQNCVWLTLNTYDEISRHFRLLCKDSRPFLAPFISDYLPSLRVFNALIHLYFANVQATLPLVHESSYSSRPKSWILDLALVSTGAIFAEFDGLSECLEAFHEFLRRAIMFSDEAVGEDSRPFVVKDLARASLLNLIGLTQLNHPLTAPIRAFIMSNLVVMCRKHGFLVDTASVYESATNEAAQQFRPQQDWISWVEEEERRRIGYCTWLLEGTLAYQDHTTPVLAFADAKAQLPCHERLWQAPTEAMWKELSKRQRATPTLSQVVQNLYSGTTLDLDLGELAHTVIIHALIRRTWEVAEYSLDPLSTIDTTPRTNANVSDHRAQLRPKFLPADPHYWKWRNMACDCLDTLHWHAHTIIATNAGLEHPVVLHLHTARICLLAPHHEICEMAYSFIMQSGTSDVYKSLRGTSGVIPQSREKLGQLVETIWRWLSQDQYKARLAVVHAGTLFWHIRRYSVSSFFEPIAMFLASLTLWTYSSYGRAALSSIGVTGEGNAGPADRDQIQDSQAVNDSIAESSPEQPNAIQIDRPMDDEIVQLFVRSGDTMQVNMNGIGNLYDVGSAGKILREGARLLRLKCSRWEIAVAYHEVLDVLAKIS